MRKTSVYLTDSELARLSSLADREGTSQAEVLRRAVRSYEPQRHGDRNFALAGCADGPGTSIADLTEEEQLEGFGS